MLADGVKRLTEERSLPSPFAVPEPTAPASFQAEFNRLQSVIEGLQKELSAFRSGRAVHFSGVEVDDDDMVVDLRHKKSKAGPRTPLAITGAAPATPPVLTGDSQQFRFSGVSSTCLQTLSNPPKTHEYSKIATPAKITFRKPEKPVKNPVKKT